MLRRAAIQRVATRRTAVRRPAIRRAAVVAVAMLGALLLPGSAATAATSDILVSDDGVTFAPELTTGLFDGSGLLVPLDSVSRSLWVQNTTATDGSLRLSIDNFDSATSPLTRSLTFTAATEAGTVVSSADQLTECSAVVPTLPIPAGETVRIDLAITVGNLTGTAGQGEIVPLDFTVDVRDAVSPFPADACQSAGGGDNGNGGNNGNGGDDDGNLSGTGVTALPWTLTSIALVIAGLWLAALARRSREREDAA